MKGIRNSLKIAGQIHIQLFDKDGNLKDERKIHNVITKVGDAWVADQLSDQGQGAMSHMAIGTGTNAASSDDTTLQTELDRNALTSTTQGAGADDNDVIYVGDWGAGDGTGAITEAGIFNNVAGGTMLCRQVFAAVNKAATDTLKITWTITCGAS